MHKSHGWWVQCPSCPQCGAEMRLSRMYVNGRQYYDMYCPVWNESQKNDCQYGSVLISETEWKAFFDALSATPAQPEGDAQDE